MRPPELRDRAQPVTEYLDLGGQLQVQLAAIAGHVGSLDRHYRHIRQMWASLHLVQITGPTLMQASYNYDAPNLLGPRTGFAWDIKRLTLFGGLALDDPPAGGGDSGTAVTPQPFAAGNWSGSITVYKSLPAWSAVVDVFTPDQATHFYGKSHLLLRPHERLVLGTSPDFTGQVAIGGDALQVADECLPAYLS